MGSINHLTLRDTSFTHSLQNGAEDVPLDERLYLLVPISGCVTRINAGRRLSLNPLGIGDFNEDMGWRSDDWKTIARIELGHSLPVFDGIGQEQTIVRVA